MATFMRTPLRQTILLAALTFAFSLSVKAQNEVAIGSATTKSNAILWLNGNGSQGLILPVVTNKTAVSSPDKGMIVYDNLDNKVWYRNDNAWVEVGGGGSSSSTLNLQVQGNLLRLRDGTTLLNEISIASGTQANGSFLVFQGGAWQYGQLSGDVTGLNGVLQVTGLRGKALATLPSSAQALVYDPSANSGSGGWIFQSVSLPTLTNGQIITGNGTTNSATTLSGDATLSGGTLTIGNNAINSAKIADGTITGTDIANTTITADKLAQSAATSGQVLKWNGTNWAPAADDAGVGATPTLANGQILTGNGTTNSATTLSGDATLSGGTLTINNNAITTAKINANAVDATKLADNAVTSAKITDATITGADIANTTITADKLAQSTAASGQVLKWNGTNWAPAADDAGVGATPTLANGQILTGNGTTNSAATVAGDATLSGGTLTIANNAINSAKIADGTVAAVDLAAGSVAGGTGGVISDGTITNADISNTAAIAGSKITPAFGAQNISTTGTLSAGATTVTGLTIGTSAWPANASGVLTNNGSGTLSWAPTGGTGTVTSLSVVSANGFTGTVATPTTTPAIMLGTSLSGILKGNGTSLSAATAGTDYQAPLTLTTTGTSGAATLTGATLNIPNYTSTTYTAGTGLTLTGGAFSVNTSQNISTLSNLTTNGLIKTGGGTGTLSIATAGTDYLTPTGNASGLTGLTASQIPSLDASKITTGALPVARGGTGLSSFGGGLLYASGPTTIGDIGNGTAGQVLKMVGTTPTWQNFSVASADITDGTIVDGDVAIAAAIAGTKISPNFGTQNISTSGTLNAGATTVSGLTIGTSLWPSNANGVLTNDGTGTLTWAAGSGWGLTGNSSTVDGTNFIGTTDNIPLNFRVNNQKSGRIDPTSAANTFLGYQSGNVTTGTENTGFGYRSLLGNTLGNFNAAFGFSALASNTTGSTNTAVGNSALTSNTTGNNNTAVGTQALSFNTGGFNSALGSGALLSNTTGVNNTGVGYYALVDNTTGSLNTALGLLAGRTTTVVNTNTTGSRNTFLGYASGSGTTTQLNNATAIGANAVVNQSNSLVLGSINGVNGASADVLVGIGTTTPAAKLDIVGTIKITDGTQGAGKVLTSDANGLASWQLAGTGSGWLLSGNALTNFSTDFIGTTDNTALAFRTNNLRRMYITNSGQTVIDINNTNPITTPVSNAILDIVPNGAGIGNIVLRGSFANQNDPVDIEFRDWGGTNTLGKIYMNPSARDMWFEANGATRLALQNDGNVGIGITTPASKLDVNGNMLIRGTNTNTAPSVSSGLELMTGRSNSGGLITGQTSADIAFNWGGASGGYRHFIQTRHNSVANSNSNAIDFYLNNSTTQAGSVAPNNQTVNGNILGMSVTAVGVGIGVTPINKLDVEGGAAIGASYSGTSTAPSNGLIVQGNVGIGNNAPVKKLEVVSTAAGGDGILISHQTNRPTLYFDNSTTTMDGAIISGTATTDGLIYSFGNASSALTFYMNMDLTGFHPWLQSLNLNLGTTTKRWTNIYLVNNPSVSSDSRLKSNIFETKYGLKHVMGLRPVSYALKSDEKANTHLGFIAQEVKAIIPEVVEGGEVDGEFLSMRYSEMIPVLTKAIQEQQEEIEDLKKKLSDKEEKVSEMESSINSMNQELENIKRALGIEAKSKDVSKTKLK